MNTIAIQTSCAFPRMNPSLTRMHCQALAKLQGRSLWDDHCKAIVAAAPGGTLIYANRAFANLVGYPREWLVGDRLPYLFRADYDVKMSSRLFNAGPLSRQIHHSQHVKEFTLRRANDELFRASISLESYYMDGSIVANVAVVTPLWGAVTFRVL